MNDFGDPGPTINKSSDRTLRAGVPRNTSFHHTNPYSGVHFQVHDTSSNQDSIIADWQNGNKNDGFVEMQTFGGKPVVEARKSRKPFFKRPPGEFYKGCRSVSVGDAIE